MTLPHPDPDLGDPAASKRERRKEARPGELLAAALDLFVEKGFASTRVEEVAALAGVSKGTLFLYFSSKEELFQAVVRENISGRFNAWSSEIDNYTGTTAELLSYAMNSWWERIGATKASGITKLIMSEARNFPEIAAFYQTEVIQPGNHLIRRILQRGMDRGEFRTLPLDYAIYSILAPMIFLVMWKHSLGACSGLNMVLNPQHFIASQIDVILHGMLVTPAPKSTAKTTPHSPVKHIKERSNHE